MLSALLVLCEGNPWIPITKVNVLFVVRQTSHWINSPIACDLRCHGVHDVIVIPSLTHNVHLERYFSHFWMSYQMLKFHQTYVNLDRYVCGCICLVTNMQDISNMPIRFLAAAKQLWEHFFPPVRHIFFTMFPSPHRHEFFRIYYHWQKWCLCKRSRSEVKKPFPDSNSSLNSHMAMKWWTKLDVA